MSEKSTPIQFSIHSALLWTAFVAVACWAAITCRSLHGLYGDLISGFMLTLGLLALLFTSPFVVATRTRRAWMVFWMGAMILFSAGHAVLSARLQKLHAEAASVVKYAHAYHAKHGMYPDDLSGFNFSDPALQPYLRYDGRRNRREFAVTYHPVQTGSVLYWYTPKDGYWLDDD